MNCWKGNARGTHQKLTVPHRFHWTLLLLFAAELYKLKKSDLVNVLSDRLLNEMVNSAKKKENLSCAHNVVQGADESDDNDDDDNDDKDDGNRHQQHRMGPLYPATWEPMDEQTVRTG